MALEIKLLKDVVPKKYSTWGDPQLYAMLTIDSFTERIILNAEYWSWKDYQVQWVEAISMLIDGPDRNTSALITGMCNPANPKFKFPVEIWQLFRESRDVYIHNSHMSIANLPVPFDQHMEDFYKSLGSRDEINSEDDKLSEWKIAMDDLAQFVSSLLPRSESFKT